MIWAAVLVGAAGCYAVKLAGLSLPQRVLDNEQARRIAELLPIALLAALIITQTFFNRREPTLDARAAGLAAALGAVYLRAPFLVVVFVAAATTALLRAVA
jgi:branched-subunit amino acid transport protein